MFYVNVGYGRVIVIGIFICIPSFPTDSDQPTQFCTLKGG